MAVLLLLLYSYLVAVTKYVSDSMFTPMETSYCEIIMVTLMRIVCCWHLAGNAPIGSEVSE